MIKTIIACTAAYDYKEDCVNTLAKLLTREVQI